ncbi:MAG: MFS transporter [Maritimibacter sp.]
MRLWILGLSAAYAVALNGTMVMPAIVLALSKLHGYDEASATIVASLELAGIAIYGLFLSKYTKQARKLVTVLGLAMVIAGEAASFYLHDPVALSAARLITGLGEGAVFSLVTMNLASLANAERLWGYLSLIGGSAMGLLLFTASLMPLGTDSAPIFLMIAGFGVVLAPLFVLINARKTDLPLAPLHSKLSPARMVIALIVVALVYAVQAAQWALCGYVGERVGLSTGEIGFYLALSSLLGFVGAVVPSVTTDKAKRLPYVLVGFVIMALSIYFLFHIFTTPVFVASQLFVNIGFYIVTPFLTGILTENDPDGSVMARTLVIAVVGGAVGTGLAGPIFASAGASVFAWSALLPLGIAAIGAALIFGHLHRGLPGELVEIFDESEALPD